MTSSSRGECTLVKKTLFQTTVESFSWKDVRTVRLTGPLERASSGGHARGTAGENLALETASGKIIAVYGRSVAWPFGTLNRRGLETHLGQPLVGEWWSVSLGGASWFISFILAAVAGVLVLMRIVVPITPGMDAGKLRAARTTNLFRFMILTLGSAIFWGLALGLLVRWLSSGAFPEV
ncbi:MAG: hypothetical protein JNM63_07085 [Spirochaetia bacterium]|nr:hypothetical protein [Spirochaetia bacterium]